MRILLLACLTYVSSTIYKLNCPNLTSSCIDDNSNSHLMSSLSPSIPACWKKEDKVWRCKEYFSVKDSYASAEICPDNYLDVFKACNLKQPPPSSKGKLSTCPTKKDQCFKDGKYYSFVDVDIPPCWRDTAFLSYLDLPENFPNEARVWQCHDLLPDNTCYPNFLDVSSCHSTIDNQCPVEFKLKECYDSNDQVIGIDSSLRNQYLCWKRHETIKDKYRCAIKANGSCLKDEMDVSECEAGLKCPTSNQKCDMDGKRYIASQSDAPKCWSDTPLGWSCTNKIDNKCKSESVDIDTCDITKKVKCPKRDVTCSSNNQTFEVYSNPIRPRCWFLKSDGHYGCRNIEPEDSCTEKEVDISVCYPKLPKCPRDYTTTCLLKAKSKVVNVATKFDVIDDDLKVLAGDPGINLCWSKDEEGDWYCQPKTGKYCIPGHLNLIKNCPELQFAKPKLQACPPSYFTACINNRKVQLAGEVKTDVCFTLQPDGKWLCKPKVDDKCNAESVDVSTCNLEAPPRPQCPKSINEKCKLGSTTIFAGKPDKHKCWFPSDNGSWKCRSPIDPKLGCRVDSVDVTQCEFAVENKLSCPASYFTKCEDRKDVFAGLTNGYTCWSSYDSGASWTCSTPIDGKCSSNQIDLSTCIFDLPEASLCPTVQELDDTKCTYQGRTMYYKDNHPDLCWLADATRWLCLDKINGACPLGTLSNLDCKPPVQRPKCPIPEAACTFKNKSYTYEQSLDRPCWIPLSRNFPVTVWSCQPRDPATNKCLDSIDVTDCDK